MSVKRSDIRICVLRIEGTNCEDETKRGFEKAGVRTEIKHLKELEDPFDYHALIFPGGFSAGDYVASGAILAARIRAKFYERLIEFIREGRVLGGVCNGFQILMRLGLLDVEGALTTNMSSRFECMPVFLKKEGDCAFTEAVMDTICLPVAHAEGRLIGRIPEEQVVFRYAKPDGSPAKGEYPYNPNGSQDDIAAICNRDGNVFGMMPHPERVLEHVNQHDWTRRASAEEGEGTQVFRSVVNYIEREL
jgi:phosphoribosylformylglycinamidine synthase